MRRLQVSILALTQSEDMHSVLVLDERHCDACPCVPIMPAYPRHEFVDSDAVGVDHCIARCVRRAFLSGFDRLTGRSYEQRKNWIREQFQQLASIFAIDVCGYAVMSNHIHVVLRGRPDLVQIWSDEAVALRGYKLFPRRDSETGKPIEPSESDLSMVVSDQAYHWWTGRAVKFERRAAG